MANFDGPRLKLERAKHHIQDFVTQAEALYKTNRHKFIVKHDAERRQRTLMVDIDTTVPDHFPLIIGDAVHNLRSALDHLTWDILRPYRPQPDKVQFPFCRKPDSFESVLTNRQIKLAGEKIAQKFRDLKPYPGGDDTLWGLHVLDITDKHELIVPVCSRIGFDVLDIRDFDTNVTDFVIRNTSYDVLEDNRIAVWRYDPALPWRPKKEKNINVAIQVLFRKEQPFADRSVPAVLREMAILVGKIIDGFSPT